MVVQLVGEEKLDDQQDLVLERAHEGDDGENQQGGRFHQELLSEIRSAKAEIKSVNSNLQRLDSSLQLIRKDIRKLGDVLDETRRDIIRNCSTRLLVHELEKDRAYPRYPFLVDVKGTLAPLKALLGKRAKVHFMCESPTDGPHPVEGQKGKVVRLEVKAWVAKVARVMVPAVKIILFLARVAATAYLPGAQVVIPTPDALVSGLGLERGDLQHVILPQALKALLEGLPEVDPVSFSQPRGCKAGELREVMEAIFAKEEIDMASDFGLHRVWPDPNKPDTYWACDHHLRTTQGIRLHPVANPFKSK